MQANLNAPTDKPQQQQQHQQQPKQQNQSIIDDVMNGVSLECILQNSSTDETIQMLFAVSKDLQMMLAKSIDEHESTLVLAQHHEDHIKKLELENESLIEEVSALTEELRIERACLVLEKTALAAERECPKPKIIDDSRLVATLREKNNELYAVMTTLRFSNEILCEQMKAMMHKQACDENERGLQREREQREHEQREYELKCERRREKQQASVVSSAVVSSGVLGSSDYAPTSKALGPNDVVHGPMTRDDVLRDDVNKLIVITSASCREIDAQKTQMTMANVKLQNLMSGLGKGLVELQCELGRLHVEVHSKHEWSIKTFLKTQCWFMMRVMMTLFFQLFLMGCILTAAGKNGDVRFNLSS